MSEVIDLRERRLALAVRQAFRNWTSRFQEAFGPGTRLSDVSLKTLACLAQAKEKAPFYLYDLIMNLEGLGSGFDFDSLSPKRKMAVIDRYLFLLDRIRFECMKRLGWLVSYPGEEHSLVELVVEFERLGPGLQARLPELSRDHPGYAEFGRLHTLDRDTFIRKQIPRALAEIQAVSETR